MSAHYEFTFYQELSDTLYKQQLWLLPYESRSYVKVGPKTQELKRESMKKFLQKGLNSTMSIRWYAV